MLKTQQSNIDIPSYSMPESIRIDVTEGEKNILLSLPQDCEKSQIKLQISVFGIIRASVFDKLKKRLLREYSIHLPNSMTDYNSVRSNFCNGLLRISLPNN